jgi:hypothetical protein
MEMMKNSIKNYLLPTMASHIKKEGPNPQRSGPYSRLT